MIDSFFKFFTNCIVVKGVNRSLIVDLQKDSFITIPDSMQEVIELFQQKKSLNNIYELYGVENKDIINEYITFLIENDFGFITSFDEFDLFIDMDNKFEVPTNSTNSIVEMSYSNFSIFHKIVSSLESINCQNIQLVFYEEVPITHLIYILKSCKYPALKSIELVLKFSNEVSSFIPLIEKYNGSITNVIFHSSYQNHINEYKSDILITHLENKVESFLGCGSINFFYFNVNKNKVLESLNHNSCLHKKISINQDGNIKNCPSMAQSFGNVKDTSLEEALNHPDFKKYWNITKDQIEVCKDCEFRHICTDCRAYVEEPSNHYSKPLKCGYSPYTNQWEEWSTNPLKQKAIEYYGMQDLVKKE